MFFRPVLCLLAALSLMGLVSAQIEDESLGELNAWGQRYLPTGEAEFATTLWRGSDNLVLLDKLDDLRVNHLSPAQRRLLRRIILSPAEAPRGDGSDALLAERARLMLALGEARAAAALVPNLPSDIRDLDAETLAVDLDMAAGREASACRALNGPLKEGVYWLKLRAVCAVLVDNFSGAELAIEFAEAQGFSDPWMIEAIFAASGDVPNPPNARYDSGLNIALSTKAELDTSRITLAGSRPDLAAAAAQRPGVPPDLKVRFATIASQVGLIDPQTRRQILLERLQQVDYEPTNSIERGLVILTTPETPMVDRAREIHRLLGEQSRAELAQYRSRAQLLLPDLRRIRATAETAEYALRFARASFAAGDNAQARRWLSSLDREGAPEVDPFTVSLLEAVDLMSGGDASLASQKAIAERLIEHLDEAEDADIAAELFSSWVGLGFQLDAKARAKLATTPVPESRIPSADMVAILASAHADAVAETGLRVLVAMQADNAPLAASDVVLLLQALKQIGADDIAADLALERLSYWQEN